MSGLDPDKVIQLARDCQLIPEILLIPLLTKLMEVLYTEDNVLELSSPVTICGDIHGQLCDLFELFEAATGVDNISHEQFLFMGDYVDRGRFSVATFAYLAALKIKHPSRLFMLRGNHECRQVNQMYGFYLECLTSYGHAGVWTLCNEVFDLLPMAALIDGRVFSVHGGLSPEVKLIEAISLIPRQDELPSIGPLGDLCWSDPDEVELFVANRRGAGYLFGARAVQEFLNINRMKMVVRSHQLAMDGYMWMFDRSLVTVWSAPNYMYRSKNKASVMKIGDGEPDFVVFTEDERSSIPPEDSVIAYFA